MRGLAHPSAPMTPPALPPRQLPGLDGVRALAVVAVVWHHAHPGWAALPMSGRGFIGVDAFFALSGLLITSLLLQEQAAAGRIGLAAFYIRRALRIFPLYYAVLGLLTLSYLLRPSDHGALFLAELPWHASYLSNWVPLQSMMAVTWSLATEEQFYLVWPPLLACLGWRVLPALLAFLVLNQLVNFGLLDGWLAAHGLRYESLALLQSTFTPILLGVGAGFALHHDATRERLARALSPGRLWLLVLVLLALLNVPADDIRGSLRLAMHVVITLLLIGLVLQPGHALVRWLQSRPLVYVGTISYGVYLLHKPGLDVARRLLARAGIEAPEALFVLGLAVTLAVAGLSFRWFERPLLKLKDRFRTPAVAVRTLAPGG